MVGARSFSKRGGGMGDGERGRGTRCSPPRPRRARRGSACGGMSGCQDVRRSAPPAAGCQDVGSACGGGSGGQEVGRLKGKDGKRSRRLPPANSAEGGGAMAWKRHPAALCVKGRGHEGRVRVRCSVDKPGGMVGARSFSKRGGGMGDGAQFSFQPRIPRITWSSIAATKAVPSDGFGDLSTTDEHRWTLMKTLNVCL
jgi:hypothetical protein